MARSKFGELEEQVLLALLQLGGESYAVPIAQELHTRTGRDASPATVFMILRRLEGEGLVRSHVGTPDPERGGRPRRFYRVDEEAVLPVLARARRARLALWSGLEPKLDRS